MFNISIKNLRRTLYIVFFFVISFNNLLAQKPIIKGKIFDYNNKTTVPGAVVKVVETNQYDVSDAKGNFEIKLLKNLPTITLETTHIAYKENFLKMNLQKKQIDNLAIYMLPQTINIDEVIVSDYKSHSKFEEITNSSNVLKGKELEKELSITLAETLKNETGLAMRSMGPAPARPVIRGLGGNRVLISEDGNKTVDLSATSPDHAVTIDPFNVNRIEVLRGPKVLTKTSTTIGGIVNVIKNIIPQEHHKHVFGSVGTYGETANKGFLTSGMLEFPISNFSVRGEISKRKSSDVRTPKGTLHNSSSDNINYSGGGSYFFNQGFIGFSGERFELDYGVPGGFVGAHPNGVNISMFRRQFNIRSKINFNKKYAETLDISFTRVLYRHKEFEHSGAIGSEFRIKNNLGYINLYHKNISILNNGIIGLSFEHRDFDIGGFVFTSPSISKNFSFYIFESLLYKNFNIEFSGRYNYNSIEPEIKKANSVIGKIDTRKFSTYSLSLSALYQFNKNIFTGFNINKSSRVPTIEELYSQGPHLAAYSYEIGNPLLEDENGIGTEIFAYYKSDDFYLNLNLFRNDFSYYIIPRATGKINYQTFLPIYQTFGEAVLFYGIENQLEWKVTNNIKLNNSVSYTSGKFKDTDFSLPQIPPLKGKIEIKYSWRNITSGINAEWAAPQNKVDQHEETTDGYVVLGVFFQFSIPGNIFVRNLSINIDNIFDKEYYNHLSRIKIILPETGRNIRLTYKLFYNL